MADINLKRFVDIDIETNVVRAASGTRETVVLFTPEGTASTVQEVSSLSEAQTLYTAQSAPTTRAYLTVFFTNGGIKCKVVEGVAYSALTADMIAALQNEEILVACAIPDANREAGYTALENLAISRNANESIYGINEKIILGRTTSSDASSVKNFAVKYSTVLGAEMTIAAYFSQINIYKIDSVYDYAFTSESLTAETITDEDYADIITNNMNVDITLANSVRNCGGNAKDGLELTNSFVRIILHQTLTDKLLELLVSKIKNNSGISKMYSVIAQELEKYRDAGYLTTDKVWSEDDLTIVYNSETYTIVTKGEALVNGYIIKILPLTALTAADKAARLAPPIYVIIADQYGIRKITINGEVI